jgi:CRISPR/Cas system CSM-associated protein Csm4 (group 5 of RAMP superfamily)
VIESGYITALAALGGAALGGLTSFATSWTTLHTQMKAQRSASSKSSRQKLYKAFIDHAAKVYGDALIHDKLETTGLINLHALVSRMRIVSSRPVIESAVKVVKMITDTYSQSNKTPEEIEAMISNGSVDILLSFSEACREEFQQSLQI